MVDAIKLPCPRPKRPSKAYIIYIICDKNKKSREIRLNYSDFKANAPPGEIAVEPKFNCNLF